MSRDYYILFDKRWSKCLIMHYCDFVVQRIREAVTKFVKFHEKNKEKLLSDGLGKLDLSYYGGTGAENTIYGRESFRVLVNT